MKGHKGDAQAVLTASEKNKSNRASRREKLKIGYIQIYTGGGKGKTTAALGQALRAAGCALRFTLVC
jgi:ATP:corrinoid adenosyltransferase